MYLSVCLSYDKCCISIYSTVPLVNHWLTGGARGVMVIVVGIGHGDTSSNPERDWLHFT